MARGHRKGRCGVVCPYIMAEVLWRHMHFVFRLGKTLYGKNSRREKFCPNPYFAWQKLLSHLAGEGKLKSPARSAGNFFLLYFAYNWSLCVGKKSTIHKMAGKNSIPILKKARKILSRNLGRNFSHKSFSRQKFFSPSPVTRPYI